MLRCKNENEFLYINSIYANMRHFHLCAVFKICSYGTIC